MAYGRNRRFVSRQGAQQHYNTQPSLTWNPVIKAYDVIFPYNKDLVDLLKATIPSSDRIYEPKTHKWTITEKYFPALKILLENTLSLRGYGVKITTKEEYESFAKEQNYGQGAMSSSTQPTLEADLKTMSNIIGNIGVYDSANCTWELFSALPLTELTKLYRRAALILHPDRNPANAEEMSKLNEVFNRIKVSKHDR